MVKSSGRAGGEQEMGGAREKIKTALRKARVVGGLGSFMATSAIDAKSHVYHGYVVSASEGNDCHCENVGMAEALEVQDTICYYVKLIGEWLWVDMLCGSADV